MNLQKGLDIIVAIGLMVERSAPGPSRYEERRVS